jgi:hypothetical protein
MSFVAQRRFVVECEITEAPPAHRLFCVQAQAGGPILIGAETFSEAALAYAETWNDEDADVRVVVTERDSGAQECFTMSFERDQAPAG